MKYLPLAANAVLILFVLALRMAIAVRVDVFGLRVFAVD